MSTKVLNMPRLSMRDTLTYSVLVTFTGGGDTGEYVTTSEVYEGYLGLGQIASDSFSVNKTLIEESLQRLKTKGFAKEGRRSAFDRTWTATYRLPDVTVETIEGPEPPRTMPVTRRAKRQLLKDYDEGKFEL